MMLFLMEVHMFRRFRNRQNWQSNLSQEQMDAAVTANRLFAAGRTGEAATIFARLAQEMEDSQHPRRAANLHARAAHAYADGQNGSAALTQARAALSLFIQYKMVNRTPQFYTNITNKMTQRGMSKEVELIRHEFGKLVGELPAQISQGRVGTHGSLPSTCTQCGAPLRSDEVEWVDDQTVECGYCGALMKTSS
jgi:HAMP domain-containing protein